MLCAIDSLIVEHSNLPNDGRVVKKPKILNEHTISRSKKKHTKHKFMDFI